MSGDAEAQQLCRTCSTSTNSWRSICCSVASARPCAPSTATSRPRRRKASGWARASDVCFGSTTRALSPALSYWIVVRVRESFLVNARCVFFRHWWTVALFGEVYCLGKSIIDDREGFYRGLVTRLFVGGFPDDLGFVVVFFMVVW